jgi:hypothetical protein
VSDTCPTLLRISGRQHRLRHRLERHDHLDDVHEWRAGAHTVHVGIDGDRGILELRRRHDLHEPDQLDRLPVVGSGRFDGAAAVKLFNAAANTGMGSFTVTPTVQVAIPANTFAGTYTSTVTVAVVSGP